jgi:hypothetical protein
MNILFWNKLQPNKSIKNVASSIYVLYKKNGNVGMKVKRSEISTNQIILQKFL